MFQTFFADFSPVGIVLFILYTIYSIVKANKKAKEKQAKKRGNTAPQQQTAPNENPNQPGQSIDDILRELEERLQGKPKVEEAIPTVPAQEVAPREKTVEDYKAENHSNVKKYKLKQDELNDGKFDDIDHRLLDLEELEVNPQNKNEGGRFSPEDLRQALIWDAILNRPDF